MNSAEFNMVVLLGLAVLALAGKAVFEYFATRVESRRLRAAGPPDGSGGQKIYPNVHHA